MDDISHLDTAALASALAQAGVGVWTYELTTEALSWSDEMYALYELQPKPASPTLAFMLSFYDAGSAQQLKSALKQAAEQSTGWSLELWLTTARGRLMSVRSRGQVIRQSGRDGILSTLQITGPSAHRNGRHAQALPDADALLRIATQAQELVFITDEHNRIEWVNRQFIDTTGYDLEAAKGKTPGELLNNPDAHDGALPAQANELKFYARSGRPYWAHVRIHTLYADDGRPIRFIHTHLDITERNQAQARASLLDQRFEAVRLGGHIGYAEYDLESGLSLWDARCFELHRMAARVHAPSLDRLEDLVAPQDQATLRRALARLRTDNTPIDVEYRLASSGTAASWIHMRAWCEPDAQGSCTHILAMYMDVTLQKQTAENLQMAQARLELASHGSGVGIFELDFDQGHTYCSDECYRLFGLGEPSDPQHMTPQAVLERLVQCIHSTDRELFTQYWQTIKQTKRFVDTEVRVASSEQTNKTGERYLLIRGRHTHEGHPNNGRIVGVVIDITELRHTQKTLQGARDRLSLAAQASRMATWEMDLLSQTSQCDPIMFHFHGIHPSEHAPATVEALIEHVHPADRRHFAQSLHQAKTSHHAVEWEYRVVHPDGQMHYLLTRAQSQFAPDGTATRVVGATLDVSASRHTSEQLREALSRLRVATEAAGVGTFERGLTHNTGRWDAAMLRLWGLPPDTPAPSFEKLLHRVVPEDRQVVSEAMARAAEVDHPIEFEYRVRRTDGKLVVLNTRGFMERNEAGTPLRIVGATVDVTTSRETQIRLREFNEWMQLSGQATGVGFFRLSPNGELLYSDRQLRVHFGIHPEAADVSLQDLKLSVLAQDLSVFDSALQRALCADTPIELEYRVFDKQREQVRTLFTRHVRLESPDAHGTYIVGAVLDVTDNRAAQHALAAAKERLDLATRIAGVGIWEMDVATGAIVWDARMRQIYAIQDPAWQPSLSAWLAMIHPQDRPRIETPLRAPLDKLTGQESEYRIVQPHGEVRSVLSRYVVERDSAGLPQRILGTELDVTEARRVQTEHDALSRRIDLMVREVGIGIWEWDIQRGSTIWNEHMYALFGRTREQFADHSWLDFVHDEDREQAQADLRNVLNEGRLLHSRYRVIWPDSSVHWISSRARIEYDAGKQPLRMVGVNWDVTDLFRADQERQQLAERISMAALGAGIGFWHFVVGSPIPYVDDQTIALYGRSRETDPEFASHWLDYVHPDDHARMSKLASQLTHSDKPVETEFRIVKPDGSIRHLAVRARRSMAADGRGALVNGVNWDVTEQRITQSMIQAKETAERASAAKSEFLSRMSHELRTPLNAVLGFAQIMDIDTKHPLDETQHERLGHIQKAGWHLLTLINEILDLSRIEAGKADMDMEAVAIGELMHECLGLISTQADQRHVRLYNELNAAEALTVWADRLRLKQIVLNLLSNAVKYNHENGSVHVYARALADHQVSIWVRDTGPGLTEHQMNEIFEPFNRLGLDGTSIEGTGIGLTISLKLAQQMGGTLTVSSQPGQGSEFCITLRQAQRTTAPTPLPVEKTSSRADITGSVLYVEDNPANVAVVEDAMSLRPGVKLFTACDGATAQVLAAVSQPDLILLDLQLPDTHGLTLIHVLKQDPALADVPCVAVSANASAQDMAAARQAGCVDFWPKPISIDGLLTGVDYWLRRPRLQTQPSPTDRPQLS